MTGLRFDEVVMVDWSAASTPRTGADSIWVATGAPNRRVTTANWPTRRRAVGALEEALDSSVEAGRRVLLGFDFAFGYPAGFAQRLGAEGEPWERVWRYFASRITDDETNANNRFEVAAGLNRAMGAAPFWGCPRPLAGLSPKLKMPPDGLAPNPFSNLRHTDELAGHGIRSVWQLYGGVTVGSQVLMGLPYLERLRHWYGDRLRVWPQQTGFFHDPFASASDVQVLMVEIWPTAFRPAYSQAGVRDEQQVRWCVERCLAQQDTHEGLGRWLAPESERQLRAASLAVVESEEGWILGVGAGT